MLLHDIDYSKVLKPQEDGYDIQVFKQIKQQQGWVEVEYPESMRKFHNKVAVLPKNESDYNRLQNENFESVAQLYETVYPLGYQNIRELVDAYVPDMNQDGNISGQRDGVEFGHPGGWGIMSTWCINPSATFANLLHELMHWKLVSLGFGLRANTFFPTTQEFILNHESELCWSIVNSYADTAQPAVGNKPTNRPVSASLHAYLSFLAVAHSHIRFLQYNPSNQESLYKAKLWGSRFDKCLDELWKVGKFTDKGVRLMMGISEWTADFYTEARKIKNVL